jgi:ABC-2 type transport system permease protein
MTTNTAVLGRAVTPRHDGVAGTARMLASETAKHLTVLWHRRALFAVEIVIMAIFFVGFQFLIGGGELVDDLLPVTAIGFLAYIVAYLMLVKVVSGLLEEMNTGTLEQIHLSPLPPWMLSVGLLTAVMVESVLVATIVGVTFAFLLDIDFPALKPDALVPATITLLDVAGFAMLMGGIALTVASIGAINHVIYSLVGILNGAYVPVYAFPGWLEFIAKLVPSTLGIDAVRRIVIEDGTLASTWADGSLQWALLHAAVMLVAGWLVYQSQVRRGLRDGRLGPK